MSVIFGGLPLVNRDVYGDTVAGEFGNFGGNLNVEFAASEIFFFQVRRLPG